MEFWLVHKEHTRSSFFLYCSLPSPCPLEKPPTFFFLSCTLSFPAPPRTIQPLAFFFLLSLLESCCFQGVSSNQVRSVCIPIFNPSMIREKIAWFENPTWHLSTLFLFLQHSYPHLFHSFRTTSQQQPLIHTFFLDRSKLDCSTARLHYTSFSHFNPNTPKQCVTHP